MDSRNFVYIKLKLDLLFGRNLSSGVSVDQPILMKPVQALQKFQSDGTFFRPSTFFDSVHDGNRISLEVNYKNKMKIKTSLERYLR